MRIFDVKRSSRHLLKVCDRQCKWGRNRAPDFELRNFTGRLCGRNRYACEIRAGGAGRYQEKCCAQNSTQHVTPPSWRRTATGFTFYFFSSMTSVDLMIAETVSPTFRLISSALRLVITLSMRLSPTRTTTCAITPPSWSSVILPSSLLRADSVMKRSITVYIDFRPQIVRRVLLRAKR